jgi:hypothetical protein
MPNAERRIDTQATAQPSRTPRRRAMARCTIITEP